MTTLRARARGVRRWYFTHLATFGNDLVLELSGEHAPSHTQDRSVEARLLRDLLAGLLLGSLGAGGHVLDLQFFQHDDAVALGVVLGLLVDEPFPLAPDLAVDPIDFRVCLCLVVTAFLLLVGLALSPLESLLSLLEMEWVRDRATVGVCNEQLHAAIDTNAWLRRWNRIGYLYLTQDRCVPLIAVPSNRTSLRLPREWPIDDSVNLPDLGKLQCS